MKAFFLGILTAVLLAVGSAVVLQGYVQKPVTEAFSTSSVRIRAGFRKIESERVRK